ncbi:MAG: hypothetical protein O3C19_07910 [Bacteroidetes bacterium]|nr:hypothetical protein [Bacteroidota bacterium]
MTKDVAYLDKLCTDLALLRKRVCSVEIEMGQLLDNVSRMITAKELARYEPLNKEIAKRVLRKIEAGWYSGFYDAQALAEMVLEETNEEEI